MHFSYIYVCACVCVRYTFMLSLLHCDPEAKILCNFNVFSNRTNFFSKIRERSDIFVKEQL